MARTLRMAVLAGLTACALSGQNSGTSPADGAAPPLNLLDLGGRCRVFIYSEGRFTNSPRCRIQQLAREVGGERKYKFFWHILLSRDEPIEPVPRTRTDSLAVRRGLPGVGVTEHIQFAEWGEVWMVPDNAAELSRRYPGGLPFSRSMGRPYITVRSELHPLVTEVLIEAPLD